MTEKKSLLARLFGGIWGAVVFLYKAIIIISLIVSLGLLWVAYKGAKPLAVEDNIALIIAPTGDLVEQIDQDPTERFLEGLNEEPPRQSLLRDVVKALEEGAADPRIAFAVLKLDGLASAGLPQMEEAAAAVQKFRAAGKKVIAYGPWYEQNTYFLAAQADEIVIDPQGMVGVEGLSSYHNFFKDALDKLGITVNVFRVGEYKSAVEPFTRNDMSPEAKAASLEWLGDLWRGYGSSVTAARKLRPTAVDDYVNQFGVGMDAHQGDAAKYAKQAGLVTHIEELHAFRERMGKTVGMDEEHGSFRQINHNQYLHALAQAKVKTAGEKDYVGLVVVQGEIVDGNGNPGQAGGDTIADLLDQARRDDAVRAVVLRVDSPGGSAWASEVIRRQLRLLKEAGKPVIASMGSVAASGGYWISMDANEIWAHNNTITGSIGIFGLIPTVDKPLEKMGIHTDGVGTTSLAGTMRLDRPLSPEVSKIIQWNIDKLYGDFIQGVATGRKLSVEQVNQIARGRVWSGEDAKAIGLVDKIGGLDAAAEAAANLAKLEPGRWELEEIAPDPGWAGKLLPRFFSSISSRWLAGLPAWAREWAEQGDATRLLRSLNDPRGMYAVCYCAPDRSTRLH